MPDRAKIGILSAVNIAEEYFEAVKEAEQLRIARQQMENDSKYYLKMWEDAKKKTSHSTRKVLRI